MDRLHEIEVFIAVAEAGGFSKAGARLGLSPPAVTRAVSALEARLGAKVFHRTTRSLTITEIGRRFLESARRITTELDAAEHEAVGDPAVPKGRLVVTASVTFGRMVVAPLLGRFLENNPGVTGSLLLLDRVVNLIDEGIDVAVRIGELPDSGLVARRVGAVRRVLVASPAYLKRRGTPKAPAELRQHTLVAFTGLWPGSEWHFSADGKRGSVSLAPRLEVNDATTAIDAVEAGGGLTFALSYMVESRLQKGRLVSVLERCMPAPQPVHLVHGGAGFVAPKVRAFMAMAHPELESTLRPAARGRRG